MSMKTPRREVIQAFTVEETLCTGTVAVLPTGTKARVTGIVRPGDKIEVDLCDLSVKFKAKRF
jgi:3-hydroxymyristoyl/3-hydroxydecanoyl-(acyl carrier protein) dehydratase